MTKSALNNKNIIITAGGTGGHIFPAMAVAEAFEKQGANITWIGTKNSMEDKLVSGKFEIKYVKSSGVRGKSISRKLLFPLTLLKSIIAAKKILKNSKADLVIGFGGYVSGPICIAAKLKKIPVFIHEQNAKMGLTNRVMAKIANHIFLAFNIDDLDKRFSQKQLNKFSIVGNPVRNNIASLNNLDKDFSKENSLKLLVLGGSQGARAINNKIPELISKAKTNGINISVWHQTGEKLFNETREIYRDITTENIHKLAPFIDDMSEAYSWSDIIICRAGALSVSEIAVSGSVAIFIPLPSAVDDHQYYNAQFMVKNDAAKCIRQDDASIEKLLDTISEIKAKLPEMSKNSKNSLIKDSTTQILNTTITFFEKK